MDVSVGTEGVGEPIRSRHRPAREDCGPVTLNRRVVDGEDREPDGETEGRRLHLGDRAGLDPEVDVNRWWGTGSVPGSISKSRY